MNDRTLFSSCKATRRLAATGMYVDQKTKKAKTDKKNADMQCPDPSLPSTPHHACPMPTNQKRKSRGTINTML
jgi:hypothetical protein